MRLCAPQGARIARWMQSLPEKRAARFAWCGRPAIMRAPLADGFLRVQQCRARGAACAATARSLARADRRLGRAPRQRHPGHLLRTVRSSFSARIRSPWYPGTGRADETGAAAGRGTTLNVPLPAGSGRAEIFGAFEQKLRPAAEKFQPELDPDFGRIRFANRRSARTLSSER